MRKKQLAVAVGMLSAMSLPGLAAAQPATEDLRQDIEKLKQENREIREALNATADMLESAQGAPAGQPDAVGGYGHEVWQHGRTGTTTVGGYGELHYNNLEGGNEIDLHRLIAYFGHEFNDDIRFFSEIEFEHSFVEGGEESGEVAIEQAFLEFNLNETQKARTGLLLVPVGILNEVHEPPTFYGVERNPVEKYIIPTTWREAGASLLGRFGQGFSYEVAAHSGLQVDAAGSFAVRGGRKAASEAPAEDLAYTAALTWRGMPGLELGGAVQYQEDVTQSIDPSAGGATLMEAHAVYQGGPFGLRALYATWDLDGTGPAALGADEQTGWYVEPSFLVTQKLGVFARYNEWDNQAGNGGASEQDQTNVGFNYWPHPDVVLKADWQDHSDKAKDGFNLGVGYQF